MRGAYCLGGIPRNRTLEEVISNVEPLDIAHLITKLALEKQASDLVILDLRGRVPYCDYFVLCNGRSRRQVAAIAAAVQRTLKVEHTLAPSSVEGLESCRWVLVDYKDVVLHIFEENMREFYDLDTLWSDAPRIEVPDQPEPVSAGMPSFA